MNTVRRALGDEQVRRREMIIEQDTDSILSEVLGYGGHTIAKLRQEGAIGP